MYVISARIMLFFQLSVRHFIGFGQKLPDIALNAEFCVQHRIQDLLHELPLIIIIPTYLVDFFTKFEYISHLC